MRLCAGAKLIATALLLLVASCASDKKVPQPPQSHVIDVTQPAELAAPRALLESITSHAGEASKVDAYRSSEGCSEVASFYQRQMKSAHWTAESPTQPPESPSSVPQSNPAALRQFTQGWKYMSRKVYVTGATPKDGSGCVVMTASFSGQRANSYQSQ